MFYARGGDDYVWLMLATCVAMQDPYVQNGVAFMAL
jgi:hypothetical protein